MKEVYIVFYTIARSDLLETGVEAFYDEDECTTFMAELRKDKATVELITTQKSELLKLGAIHA